MRVYLPNARSKFGQALADPRPRETCLICGEPLSPPLKTVCSLACVGRASHLGEAYRQGRAMDMERKKLRARATADHERVATA